jgi:hypothetical protein
MPANRMLYQDVDVFGSCPPVTVDVTVVGVVVVDVPTVVFAAPDETLPPLEPLVNVSVLSAPVIYAITLWRSFFRNIISSIW